MSEASGSTQRKGSKGSKDIPIPVELLSHLRKEIWDIHAKSGATISDIIAQLSKDTNKMSFGNKADARIVAEIAKHLDDSDVVSLMQASHFTKDSIDPKQRPRYKEYDALLPKLYQIAQTADFQQRHTLLRALPPQRYFQSAVTQLKRMVAAPTTYSVSFAEQFDPQNYIHSIIVIALRNLLETRLKLERGKIQGYPFSQYFHEADGMNVVLDNDGHYINKLLFPDIDTILPNFDWSFKKVLNQLYPSGLKLQQKVDEWMATFTNNRAHPAYKHAQAVSTMVAKINRLTRLLIHSRLNIMLQQSETDVVNEYIANYDMDATVLYLQMLLNWYDMAPKKHYLSLMKQALLHRNTLRAWTNEEQKEITRELIVAQFGEVSGGARGRRGRGRGRRQGKKV